MYYPLFLFDPETLVYVTIDSMQQLSRTASSSSQRYTRSSTGQRGQISQKDLAAGTFGCTWYTSNWGLEWYLESLVGKDVVFGYGPRSMASYVTVQSVPIVHTPGNSDHIKVNFDVTFLGATRGFLLDAGDSRCVGGTLVTDTTATLDVAAQLSAQWQMRQFVLVQNVIMLPEGNYRMFARVKDAAHVSGDVFLGVYSGANLIASWLKTATASYVVYMIDFTIGAAHLGQNITFQVRKATTTGNNIYVDFLGCVAVP